MGRLRRFRLSRRVLLVSGAALAVAALLLVALSTVVLPYLVRRAVLRKLEARVTAPVRVGDVHVNLLTGRASIADIVIGGQDGGLPILRLAALDVGVSYRALLRGATRLRYVAFQQPRALIERTGPESVNVLQALRPQEGGEAPRFTIEQLTVQSGAVTFIDRTQTPAFERTFTDVTLTTDRISNLPTLRFTPTSFEARFGIGGGALTVTGATAPFGQPAGVELTARMERLDPGLLKGYLPLRARIDLRGSQVDGEVRYRLAYRGEQVVQHGVTAHVETGPIRFLPPDDDTPLVSVAALAGRDIEADFLTNRVRLGDIALRAPLVKLVRGPGGLNLTRLVAAESEPAPPEPPPEAAPTVTRQAAPPADARPPVRVVVGRARIEGGTVEFVDRTTAPAVAASLSRIGLRLQDVSLGAAPRPGRLEGEAAVEGGRLQVDGSIEGGTLATSLRVAAHDVRLERFRPYFEPALRGATARGGVVGGRVEARLDPRTSAGPLLELAGQVEAAGLALTLPDAGTPSLTARRLGVDVARLRVLPAVEADITRVRLAGATLRLRRDSDGNLDVARLWSQSREREAAPPRPERETSRPVTLRRMEVARTRIELTDAAVSPPARATIDDLHGELRQVAGQEERMTLRARGAVGEAPLELQGWLTPFAPSLRAELRATVRDYDLPALDPYAVHYVSHHLRRGRLTAEVAGSYDGGRYAADTTLTVRHLDVGDPVDDRFAERVGIPFKLAVSLLEGPDHMIRLRLPIRGDAEGRRIDFGQVLTSVLRNTIVKVAAAPFRAFGSLVTLGGRIGQLRIDPVEFRPGSLEPNDDSSARLAKVIEFLEDKPRLGLELRGVASPAELEAFKRERLREELKKPPPTLADAPLVALYRQAGGPAGEAEVATDEMRDYVLAHMHLGDDELRELADERARVIRETLVRRGVAPGRLFVVEAGKRAVADGTGRVDFALVY